MAQEFHGSPQSEMEALLKLQKETIESLRQLVDSQRLMIEQLTKSHEEQTAQLNQTIANPNETVDYLKKKLFASSSERTKTDTFPGQMDLFNEAEVAADPSVPEPTLETVVSEYNKLKGVTRCGCLAHMRRYWYDALPGKTEQLEDKTPAETGFDYCNKLFNLEEEYAGLDAQTRKAKRLETELAIWKAYWSWLETVNPAGGSRLAKAVICAKNQKPYMENYLLDGRCSISNNIAENIARSYAVWRKNFLFHDTVKGAQASSVIYSLVETAKFNNLNIYAYLENVLLYMPDYKNEPEEIEELMPWSEKVQQSGRIKSKS